MAPDHKAKIGASNKGKVRSEETRAKISHSKMGSTHSAESRAKISAPKNAQRFERLRRLLGEASGDDKVVLTLFLEGLTPTEVAAHMGWDRGTMRARLAAYRAAPSS